MVADADKFKAQDDAIRKKIESKNTLENYCFQMGNVLQERKLKPFFTPVDVSTISSCVAEGLQFVQSDPEDFALFDAKQRELEGKFNPIMMRVYQSCGPDAPDSD